MTRRFHVATPAQIALLRIAIDQAAGYRDAAGVAVLLPHKRVSLRTGAVRGVVMLTAQRTLERDVHLADNGECALELNEHPKLDALLDGRAVNGVILPTVASLAVVTRPRGHSALSTGLRDKLDDVYLDGVFAGKAIDDPGAVAEAAAELQGRATAAIARLQGRRGAQLQAALESAVGIGRSR